MRAFLIRFFDLIISIIVLTITFPIIVLSSISIYIEDGLPILFLGERVKKNFQIFKLYKLRSMRKNSSDKFALTKGSKDLRITKVGSIIRKYKIDELPQLLNVIKGEISLVGYRPESFQVVKKIQDFNKLKKFKPGITDWASLFFVNEEEILSKKAEKEKFYLEKIVPQKIRLNLIFYENKSIMEYFKILTFTFIAILLDKNFSKKYLMSRYSRLIDNIFK